MKRAIKLILLLVCIFDNAHSQIPLLIPYPREVKESEGVFVISKATEIKVTEGLESQAVLFSEGITGYLGYTLKIITGGRSGDNILLRLDKKIDNPEGYELYISPSAIEINARGEAGIFYGLQTLSQLIISSEKGVLKSMTIKDAPRFPWRGEMLDVSRTFMPVLLVKRYIDLFARIKLNVVHLHLTDDQGWRIEIRRYPLLTEIGSKFDAKYNTMGGYYSQDDIRDLVSYALKRNITLVPEIEMPGHACAALASYPELSCAGTRPEIHTFFEGP